MSSSARINPLLNSDLYPSKFRNFLTPVIILLLSGLVASGSKAFCEEEDFSESNKLLFMHDHLSNIADKSRLEYSFIKTGSLEQGFEDTINLNIIPAGKAGEKVVKIDYFSGDRKRWAPEFSGAEGNPLLTIFLQRDIYEMQRLTDGQWRHFQKRIKLALENQAKSVPVVVIFSGREYMGKQITIYPYIDDPYNKLFAKHKDKYYVFTLADELPGMIYQIKTVTPGSGTKDPTTKRQPTGPLLSETITLRNIRLD